MSQSHKLIDWLYQRLEEDTITLAREAEFLVDMHEEGHITLDRNEVSQLRYLKTLLMNANDAAKWLREDD